MELILEQAARTLSIANDIWTPLNVRAEAEDITACLLTAANQVAGYGRS
jgi:hypothetical protein